ncbi:class I SAM-dependent methyltransferase, partial [Verrucomicrobiota bacterium]
FQSSRSSAGAPPLLWYVLICTGGASGDTVSPRPSCHGGALSNSAKKDSAEECSGAEHGRGAAVPEHVWAEYPDGKFFQYRERFLRHLMEELAASAGSSGAPEPECLDVGCNTGRYTRMLWDYGLHAIGVDRSEDIIRMAEGAHPGLRFVQGDALSLPFEDGRFPFVVAFGTVQCVERWQDFLAELCRVMRPGGAGLVETNRAFPFPESLARSLAYAMRGRKGWREAVGFFRSHAAGSSSKGLKYGPMKFTVREIVSQLRTMPVSSIVVHDPRKRRVLHDFCWAVRFVKSAEDSPAGSGPRVETCGTCAKGGIAALCPGGAAPGTQPEAPVPDGARP